MTTNGDDNVIGLSRHVQTKIARSKKLLTDASDISRFGDVGAVDYGVAHVPAPAVHDAEVIDLAVVRERLGWLRDERQNLTRRANRPVGEGNSTHTGSPTLSPTTPPSSLHAKKPSTGNAPHLRRTRAPQGARTTKPSALLDSLLPEGITPLLTVGDGPATVGVITHRVIGILAPHASRLDRDLLIETVLLLARTICPSGRMHRKTSTLVAGYTSEYLLTVLRPRSPWEPIQAELPVPGGRIDLAWRDPTTGQVFFDEIKTTEVTRTRPDDGWLKQCATYAAAGAGMHGDAFLGVRLLPLGSMNVAALVRTGQPTVGLRPTLADPLGVTAGGS